MDKIICFCGGLLLGAAFCLSITMNRRPMDKALVLQAREYVTHIAQLEDAERNAYLDRVAKSATLLYKWRIACLLNNEFGGVRVSAGNGRCVVDPPCCCQEADKTSR